MKVRIILLFFLFSFSSLIGQNVLSIENNTHSLIAGDSIFKYQIAYKDHGLIGQDLHWDFSSIDVLNENYLIKYFIPDSNDLSKLSGLEHNTHYYYRQKKDSLWSLGFENYTTQFNFDEPELKMIYPFHYGDTLYSHFEGKGMYSNFIPLQAKGYTKVVADATGTILLPDDNKKHKTLRTHSIRNYTEVGKKDTLKMTLETYSWYVKGIRYPVFETITNTLHTEKKDTVVLKTSFYYSPREYRNGEKEYEDEILQEDSNSLAETIFTEARMQPNPVINDLIIDFKLTRNATIGFSIHNNIGQPMCTTQRRELNEGLHQETIPMEHLYTGTYALYVHVDNMILKRVIIKN